MAASPEPAPAADWPADQPARSFHGKTAIALFIGLYVLLALPAILDAGLPLPVLLISGLLAAALIALSVIDLATMRLPDVITVPLIVAGPVLAWVFGWDDLLWGLVSAAAGFAALFFVAEGYRALRGRPGLGLGDAKLFAAAGAWLGIGGLPSVLLWGCGIALATVLLALAFRRKIEGSTRIPFGPFLALGFWMVWLYGPL
jgi:leader peptidase (prepilin peptidase)/N-methyltransferase